MTITPTKPANGSHARATGRTTLKLAMATLLAPVLLSGCSIFVENSLDTLVYFDNRTDQTLYVRPKGEPVTKDDYFRIEPLKVTHLRLVGRGKCTELVVITGIDAKVVKDPGKVCWHDTVTIP